MSNSFEHKISVKIALIFFVVTAYFSGLFIYLGQMNKTINEQRQEVEDLSRIVSKTNLLILTIQEAQNITNEYLFSHAKRDLERYEVSIGNINRQIEDLGDVVSEKQNQSAEILKEISELLEKKNDVVKRLSLQLNRQNPMKDMDVKIDSIQENVRETIEITVRRDSITLPSLNKPEKKQSFWRRLKNVFNPSESASDTTTRIVDVGTTRKTTIDTVGMFSDLRATTNELTVDYQRRIAAIEQRVRQLVIADADIFSQISQLLTRFHEETLLSVLARTNANEQLTRKVYRFAMNSGGLSLLLILFIILLIVDDLSKGRKARRDLVKEKQLTDRLMESRHKLLLTVSHDIKTPLSSMMGYMDLWRSDETDTSKKWQLQSALNSGEHILNMLTNLLEYSRLEKRAFSPKESVFDLDELCGEVIEMFRPLARERNLGLKYCSHTGDKYFVRSDHTAIKQILTNILSNAVKYTVEGSVELVLEESGGKTGFRVADTGVGIDAQRVQNAFRPFSRMDNPVSAEGSGFGLYVAKGLVDAMKGEVGLESEIGKGTVVNIVLPLEKVPPPEKREDKKDLPAKSRKILVFEDDESLGNVLVEIIQRMGHEVVLRDKYGETAIDTSPFDIVFTDMEMGETSGNDILAEIRKTNGQIPVWLLTAHGDISQCDAKQAGFSGLIAKPVTISALKTALQSQDAATEEKHTCPENGKDDFPLLYAMFDGDQDSINSINSILQRFAATAGDDMRKLRLAVGESHFAKARQICHKILPFLLQLDSSRINLETPKKMNGLKDDDEQLYPQWKDDVIRFVSDLEYFARWVKDDYLRGTS